MLINPQTGFCEWLFQKCSFMTKKLSKFERKKNGCVQEGFILINTELDSYLCDINV